MMVLGDTLGHSSTDLASRVVHTSLTQTWKLGLSGTLGRVEQMLLALILPKWGDNIKV